MTISAGCTSTTFAGDDQLDYAFMGTDPAAQDNVWLREAAERALDQPGLPSGLGCRDRAVQEIKISAERDRVRKLTDGLCQIADGCDEAEELRERATNVLSRNAVRD